MTTVSVADLLKKKKGIGKVFLPGNYPKVNRVSSGLVNLDVAIGGGIPTGRVIHLYGEEAAGKTTLMMKMLEEHQNRGGQCVYVDLEYTLSDEDFDRFGLNRDPSKPGIVLIQPANGTEAVLAMQYIMENTEDVFIVVDSVSELIPKIKQDSVENDIEKQQPAALALFLTRVLLPLRGLANSSNSTLFFINQLRKQFVSMGNPETFNGGHALRHAMSINLRVGRGKPGSDGSLKTNISIKKNKVGSPSKNIELTLIPFVDEESGIYAGFNSIYSLIEAAVDAGWMKKASYYSLTQEGVQALGIDPNKDDGRFSMPSSGGKGAYNFFVEHPEYYRKMYSALVSHLTGSGEDEALVESEKDVDARDEDVSI